MGISETSGHQETQTPISCSRMRLVNALALSLNEPKIMRNCRLLAQLNNRKYNLEWGVIDRAYKEPNKRITEGLSRVIFHDMK